MKAKLRFSLSILVISILTPFLFSCSDDQDGDKIRITIDAKINVDTCSVKQGENITFTLEGITYRIGNDLTTTLPPDEGLIRYVTYYVDGKEVGTSYDMANNFALEYTVGRLSAGTHQISAHCESGNDNYLLTRVIQRASFTVVDKDKDANAKVDLTYSYSCEEDLLNFVTPKLTYTDETGEHTIVLDETCMTSSAYAYCYCYEDGEKVYDVIELDEDGNVPEPWIIEEISSKCYHLKLNVNLNKVDVVNNCIVTYHRKSNYEIIDLKEYNITHRLECYSAHSSVYTDILHINNYTNIHIGINTTKVYGNQLEEYLDRLCSEGDIVSMQIDKNGKFTNLTEE